MLVVRGFDPATAQVDLAFVLQYWHWLVIPTDNVYKSLDMSSSDNASLLSSSSCSAIEGAYLESSN
jgi:hypothetical protein